MDKNFIFHAQLQVCSACQYDCKNCVTEIVRKSIPKYQLTIEQLKQFIRSNEESNYYIAKLWLNGLGDPLLWKHMNEGIELLRRSKSVGKIYVRTNGLAFDRLEPGTIKHIDELSISVYPENKETVQKIIAIHGHKIKEIIKPRFREIIGKVANIPCSCRCHGPTIIGDSALVHCGPVLFSSATMTRLGIVDLDWPDGLETIIGSDGFVKVEKGYLDCILSYQRGDRSKRSLDACKYCWGNRNFKSRMVRHEAN